jgi:hypothetical protein
MAIIGQTVAKVSVLCSMVGQLSHTRLLYFPTTNGEYGSAQEVALYFQQSMQTAWLAAMSGAARLERITVDLVGPVSDTATVVVGATGTAGSAAAGTMPPWVAASFVKHPQNSQIEGTNTIPFRVGGFRLMGALETWSDAGVIVPAGLGVLNSLANALLQFTVPTGQFGDVLYNMYMDRPPLTPFGPPESAAPVFDISVRGHFTSQNSRKF